MQALGVSSRRRGMLARVDDARNIPCAANLREPCLKRGAHRTTCLDPDTCDGCEPRPAVHGYLCRRHYEQVERAGATYDRLCSLARTLGNDSRAIQATGSASTIAGPRVPLSALQLDLDALHRMDAGDVRSEDGALQALAWARQVFGVAIRHPTEPRKEGLKRTRCQQCNHLTCIVCPPEFAGDRHPIRCMNPLCGWTSSDPDYVEAVAHMEIRVDARTRKWVNLQTALAGDRIDGEDRAGLARVADALR